MIDVKDAERLVGELRRAQALIGLLPRLEGLERLCERAARDDKSQEALGLCCEAYRDSLIQTSNMLFWMAEALERIRRRA